MSIEFDGLYYWVMCRNPFTETLNPVKKYKTKKAAQNYVAKHSDC